MNMTLRIKVPGGSVNIFGEKFAYEDNTTTYRYRIQLYLDIKENVLVAFLAQQAVH